MLGTPLILFLILLSALVISMLFGNSWLLSRKEGFVAFGYSNPNIMEVTISHYSSSNTVIYLYDNLYFDGKNGNIVEVDSKFCGNVRVNGASLSGNIGGNIHCDDTTGSTITQLWVTTNSAKTSNFQVSSSKSNSALTNLTTSSMTPKIGQLTYLSNSQNLSEYSSSGYRYQLFNITWGSDTFLHLLALDPVTESGKHIKSFYYNKDGAMMRYIDFNDSAYMPKYNEAISTNADTNDSKSITDTAYDSSLELYQITKRVKYDIKNGHILIGEGGGSSYTVYNRSTGSTVSSDSTKPGAIEDLSFFVSTVITDGNNGAVLIMSFGKQTVIAILTPDPTQKYYNLSYCARFDDTKVVISLTDDNNIGLNNNDITDKDKDIAESPCHDELSCKWYYYFKTIGNDTSKLFKNDFIRKTQIVPPVCPRCPSCPAASAGVCNSCGGNGGCGATDISGDTPIRDEIINNSKTRQENRQAKRDEIQENREAKRDEIQENREERIEDIEETIDEEAPGEITTYAPADMYSYYGVKHTSGSNYMPVTASFSAFSK